MKKYAALVFATATLTATSALAADPETAAGAAEFAVSCAACHGASAKGDGEVAPLLVVKPADLTQLAKKNDGQFPFLKVFQTIDGRAAVKSHGTSMPVWGDRYSAKSGATGIEPYKSWSSEPFVRARILELTYYLQSVQE